MHNTKEKTFKPVVITLTTREEAEKARIIWDAVTEALNKRGHNYASILSAKSGLEALIEG